MKRMDKREKVIKGLECCVDEIGISHAGCPYYTDGNKNCGGGEPFPTPLLRDALELLKAQEPAKPYAEYSEHTGTKWLVCGACKQPMIKITPNAVYPNYCPECGREVWWE